MARKRMVDPSFWIDEKLGECDPMARLTFMGLISQSDDDGRLNGHPALIKSVLFPYDYGITNEQVKEWLRQLEERCLIIQYQVNNQSYICLPNFNKHQTINKRTPSKLPSPPNSEDYGSTTVVAEEEESSSVVQKKRKEEKRKEEKKDYADFVSLTETEYQKIKELYQTDERVQKAIDILNNYKASKGKKYKSDYHVLIGWVKEDMDKKHPLPKQQEEPKYVEPPDFLNEEWH